MHDSSLFSKILLFTVYELYGGPHGICNSYSNVPKTIPIVYFLEHLNNCENINSLYIYIVLHSLHVDQKNV